MTFRNLYTKFYILMFLSFGLSISAQDLHYSQFYNSPQNLNPALTGVFDGDHRFTFSMRDQWRFVPVPWTTFSLAYDKNIPSSKNETLFYGLGFNFNYDKQGDSRLTFLNLGLNGSIHKFLNKKNIIGIGANLGYATKGFDTKSLRWDKQWNGDNFDTSLPSEELFANTERIHYLETSLGVNYRYQKSTRTHLDLGIAALHLLEPKASFYGVESTKLPRRYTMSGVGNFKLTDQLDLQLHALHQIQSEYNETVLGGLAKFYLNQNPDKELQLHLGLGYRTSGSLIPTIAFEYKQWYVGFNIDSDGTPFNQALNTRRGAYELHVRHIIKNVRPFRYKNCTIL